MTQIFDNYNVKNDTTFKIGGCIKKAAFPENVEEFIQLLNSDEYDMVLGSCSNVLFSSQDVDKKIIFTKNLKKYSFEGNILKTECGVKGPLISKECQKLGLSGFEFLIGFPGSFGGMICMNASAHNQAISDKFVKCRVFDTNTKQVISLNKEEMQFLYRNSAVSKNKYIVLDAEFELDNGNQENINEIMRRNIEFRQERQPSLTLGNAGSIFKNPSNDSAGRLLDLCEMKGVKEGGAMVYKKHANFILNYDNATSLDVITLMYKMFSKVREKYTIKLTPEIIFIGNKETEEQRLWDIMTEENIH